MDDDVYTKLWLERDRLWSALRAVVDEYPFGELDSAIEQARAALLGCEWPLMSDTDMVREDDGAGRR